MNSKFGSKAILAVVASLVSATATFDPEKTILDTLTSIAVPTATFTREAGIPLMHDKIEDHCHGKPHLCNKHGRPVLLQSGHHARSKTDQPIFGILTQPLPDQWQENDFIREGMYTSYFEASHAEYLQASGARTVHIDYTMPIDDLRKELAQLNGLYIPGDGHTTLDDLAFRHTVA